VESTAMTVSLYAVMKPDVLAADFARTACSFRLQRCEHSGMTA